MSIDSDMAEMADATLPKSSARRPLRILLVCQAFRSIGGVQEVVDNLAVELTRLGQTVSVLASPYIEPGCERAIRTDAECSYVEIPSYKPATWRHPERLLRPPSIRVLVECFRRWNPDVVNSHTWDWDKIPPMVKSCLSVGVPLVQSLYDEWGAGKMGARALESLREAAHPVALSNATRTALGRLAGQVRDADVIVGGVDCAAALAARPHERGRSYIFCAARADLRHKATDQLVRGFGTVAAEFPGTDLLIAGAGPDTGKLQSLVSELGLKDRVVLLGAVSRDQLWSFHKGALFFVMLSRMTEGLGLGFLEAMACGKPAVATRIGGTPEIVLPDQTGVLVKDNSAGAVAQALRRLLSSSELRQEMSRHASAMAASMDWSRVAQRYLEVYRRAIDSSNTSSPAAPLSDEPQPV
jgi:glycosyltransferase involved in cell wall biosynthesis